MTQAEQSWPTPIASGRVADDPPAVNLTTLAPATKRAVWNAISAEYQELAELLATPDMRELATRFQGEIIIDRADLPASAISVLDQPNEAAA